MLELVGQFRRSARRAKKRAPRNVGESGQRGPRAVPADVTECEAQVMRGCCKCDCWQLCAASGAIELIDGRAKVLSSCKRVGSRREGTPTRQHVDGRAHKNALQFLQGGPHSGRICVQMNPKTRCYLQGLQPSRLF
jgi:hypothetical protein